jgi:osmotically-inducible protein OsmY
VLSGTVGTVGEIERATAVAQAVEGVHVVQNRILLGGASLDGTH